MTEKKETQKRRARKLQTAWREEPICPHCHDVITGVNPEDGSGSPYSELDSCPSCGNPVSIRMRTKTEYLILS